MTCVRIFILQILLFNHYSGSVEKRQGRGLLTEGIVENEVFTRHDESYEECGKNTKLDRGTGFIFKDDEDDGPGTWPWLVSIGEKAGNWKHRCGGSLITRRHVLTAAHCALQLRAKLARNEVLVRAGDGHLRNDADDYGVQVVPVVSYRIHPEYKRPLRYFDVGVLLLSKSLALTTYVRTICPPSRATKRSEDNHLHLVVAGWGASSQSQVGKNLVNTNVQVYSEGHCNNTHVGQNRYQLAVPRGFTDDLFCGGDPAGSEGVCHGDSGSPVVLFLEKKYVLKGVVSGGLSCGTSYHPNIYVRLGSKHVLNWIHQQVSSSTFSVPKSTKKTVIPNPTLQQENMKLQQRISSGWALWSSWSICSRECGIGKTTRKRLCTGMGCSHKQQSQERFCNTQRCTH